MESVAKLIMGILNFLKNKKGIEIQMLLWWIIAIFILVIIVVSIFVLKGKGSGAMEFIWDLFRFKGK